MNQTACGLPMDTAESETSPHGVSTENTGFVSETDFAAATGAIGMVTGWSTGDPILTVATLNTPPSTSKETWRIPARVSMVTERASLAMYPWS